ncbi:MAG: hypothetical protein P8R42_07130 [Candidatus Binatia bacterium]|nr:hypothetical protein [Candidatus Binatia bacterium]
MAAVALGLCFPLVAGAIVITTADGNGADGYAGSLFPTPFENDEHIKVKSDRGSGGLHNKGYARFDLSSVSGPISAASLNLTLDIAPEVDAAPGETVGVDTLEVYGLNDGHADEAWVETQYGVLWADAPANDQASPNGLLPGEATFLGTFDLTSGVHAIGDTFTFSTAALAGFLQADTNDLVTLIFVRIDRSFAPAGFATKEHPSLAEPALDLTTATTTPTPTPVPTPSPSPSPGSAACPAVPLAGCRMPSKSFLMLADKEADGPGPKDKLLWKYLKGPAETQAAFGEPDFDTDYTLCVYDDFGLAIEAEVAGAGSCNGKPCWKAIGTKGYKFKDKATGQDGIFSILMKGDPANPKTKILVTGKDAGLPFVAGNPLLGAGGPIAVRLSNSTTSNCWGADFPPESVKKNSEEIFKAKTP